MYCNNVSCKLFVHVAVLSKRATAVKWNMDFYRETKASWAAPLIRPPKSVRGELWMSAEDLWAVPVHPDAPGCCGGWVMGCSWFGRELLLIKIAMIHYSHGEWWQLAPPVAQPCSIHSPEPSVAVPGKDYVKSDDDLRFPIWYAASSTASYCQSVKSVQINIWSLLPFWGGLEDLGDLSMTKCNRFL